MILFFLLLLDPSSFLHPPRPGCAVPGDHALSTSCATAVLDRGRSSSPTTRPLRPSAAKRPPLWGLRDSLPYLHVCKTHKLFLQRTVIGLGLTGTNAEG